MDIRPNHTIYVNRLNEKVKKEGMLELYGFSRVDFYTYCNVM